jgi:hypothetical protein
MNPATFLIGRTGDRRPGRPWVFMIRPKRRQILAAALGEAAIAVLLVTAATPSHCRISKVRWRCGKSRPRRLIY